MTVLTLSDYRPAAQPADATRPARSSYLSAYLHPDGSLEVRKADRPAPPGAIALYLAFDPGRTSRIRRLFVPRGDRLGLRAIEFAQPGEITTARFQRLAAVYRARVKLALED